MERMEQIKLEVEAAKQAGFSNEEIKSSYSNEINAAKQNGFSDDQINATYGLRKPDPKIVQEYVSKITKDYLSEEIVSPEDEMLYQSRIKQASEPSLKEKLVGPKFDGDYISEQILGTNLWNLSKRAIKEEGTPEALKMPRPEDYTWTEEFLTTLGTLAIDSPLYALSAIPGALIGTGVSPGVGTVVGGAFTAAAIPTTTRETLLKVLENQDEGKPSDVMQILLEETLKSGAKEGLKFSAAMALPLLRAFPGAAPLASNYFTRTAAQITGYQGTGLLLGEEMPDMREFSLTSALFAVFNLRLPKRIATAKSKKIFIDYGKKPTDVALDSSKSRTLREDLLSTNMKIIRDYEKKDIIDVVPKEIVSPNKKIIEQKIIELKNKNKEIYKEEREKNDKDRNMLSPFYKKIFKEERKKDPNINNAEVNRIVSQILSDRTNKKLEPIIEQIKKLEKQIDKSQIIFEDPIANKAAENISFEGRKIPITKEQIIQYVKQAAKTSKRKFIIKAIDKKYPVLEALQEAKINTKTGLEKLNEYELLRLQEGMQGRSAHFIEFGTLDFKTLTENGPSLTSIVSPFVKESKNETALFGTYLTNRHAVTLAKRGKDTPVDIPNAEIFLKKYTNRKVKDPETGKMISYEQAAKKVDIYQDAVLKYAADGGLITKESYNAYKEINKNYMPMAAELPRPGESGFIKGASNPFKKLKGQKKYKVIDPLESILKNTDYIIRMTELNKTKNDFMNIVLEAKKKDPLAFDWIQKKKGDLKPITVQRKELEKFFDKETLDQVSNKGVEELAIFRQEVVYPDANSISYRNTKTGKYEIYTVGEDLATAFRVMDNQSMGFVAKWLTAPTRTLRTGAIVTPDFAVPNFIKDTMNATFLSKVGWIPIIDSFKGIFHVIYKDPKKATEAYKRFLKGGGAFSTLRSVDRTIFDRDAHTLLNKGVMRNEYSTPILGQFKYLTDISELSTRVMMNEKVYQKAKKQGLSERDALQRAGFESKDLLDYTRQGTVAGRINKGVPFFTARINGAVKAYEAGRDRPKKFFSMIGLAVVLPTFGFYISNLDKDGELDKDYKELPDYVKNNKYYYKIDGKGRFFPKGFEVGTFFSNLTEKVLDYIRTNEKQEFMSYVGDFLKEHAKGYTPIPTFLRPHLENLLDYSIFREAPILPPNAPKDMLNSEYSTVYTNPTLKELSRGLTTIVGADNYFSNPIYVENIYDSYFGGVGRMVKDVINKIAITSGVIDDPIKPTDPISKIPGVRVFQAKDVYGYSQSVSKFYKKTKKLKTQLNTLDYLKRTGNMERYKELREKTDFDIEAILEITKGMSGVSKDIKVIYNARNKDDGTLFTSDEKKDLIDDLMRVRIGLAQKGLQIMKELEQNKE
jgi:hypothetical protein